MSLDKPHDHLPDTDAALLVCKTAGALFGQWGYREILGRVWAVLFLTPQPIDASSLRRALNISSGALSMALKELIELGLVYRETAEGERRFHYRAETDIWPVITRIFRARERDRFNALLTQIKHAETLLQQEGAAVKDSERRQFQLERVRHLMDVGQFAIDFLDAFMGRTKIELKAARKWLSVSEKLGGEPLSRLRRAINRTRERRNA